VAAFVVTGLAVEVVGSIVLVVDTLAAVVVNTEIVEPEFAH
jgi:hypothetical protein